MKTKIIAANWKMNLSLQDAIILAQSIVDKLIHVDLNGSVVLMPPNLYIDRLTTIVQKCKYISLGGQNIYTKTYGAHTGEVSASMLASVQAKYVLIGHSERRMFFDEDSNLLTRKLHEAIEAGLTPIFCFGEPISIKNSKEYLYFLSNQVKDVLFNFTASCMQKVVIAYEPIWAIGTGLTPDHDYVKEIVSYIRAAISRLYNAEIADTVPVLYGGSCNAENASELYSIPGIDGLLVGGASLDAEGFAKIVESTINKL